MRKINRRTADPEILEAYEMMRYDRRYPKLEIMAWVIRAIGYAGVLPIFFIPEEMRLPYLKVWLIFAVIAIIMEFSLMVAWQPRGYRLRTFLGIVAVLGTAVLMMAGFIFGMFFLLSKLT